MMPIKTSGVHEMQNFPRNLYQKLNFRQVLWARVCVPILLNPLSRMSLNLSAVCVTEV